MNIFNRYYIGVIIMALIGFAISLAIKPRENEIAFIHFQDKHFSHAYSLYQNQWKDGNRTLGVVIPLSKLYLQYGRVEKAIEVMEDFVDRFPNSVEARMQLGVYYQYNQMPNDYLRNLEQIYAIQPTEKIIRELSDIYNYNGQYEKQIDILEELINEYKPVEKDFVDLTYLYASIGQYYKASEVLKKLFAKLHTLPSPDTMAITVSVLLDTAEHEKAVEEAVNYIEKTKSKKKKINLIIEFSSLMIKKGAKLSALSFIENFTDTDNKKIRNAYLDVLSEQVDKTQFTELVKVEIDGEYSARRLKKLARLSQGADVFDMAELAYQKVLDQNPDDSETLRELAVMAYDGRNYKTSKKFFTTFFEHEEEGDHLSNFYYAELLMQEHNKDEAKGYFTSSLSQIESAEEIDDEQLLIKAQIFVRLSQPTKALPIYRSLVKKDPENSDLRADLAELLIDQEFYEEAESVLVNVGDKKKRDI